MLLFYNVLSAIALVLYLPWLFLKKGPGSRARFIRERLGLSRYDEIDIWVHAVSVGETIASIPLIKKLKQEFPEKKIVFSTTTYTGQKIAADQFRETDRVLFMPWDTSLCSLRVIRQMKPELFITIETEIWPYLYHRLKKSGSRVLLLNGRLSGKSYREYRLITFFMRRVLSNVDYCFMQSDDDASRIIALGADESRVGVMGNLKFDVDFTGREPLVWLADREGEIFLAGSTHRGEDEIILDAFSRITESGGLRSDVQPSDVKLILAPRHPERFDEVEYLLKERGLHYIRRTNLANRKEVESCNVILLDTIGELSHVFSAASVTFIGGSLLPYGGHNVLEPAWWGKPVLFGPHMDNFPIAKEFLRKSAALAVKDADDIANRVMELLANRDRAQEMGQKAKAIVDIHAGAADRAMERIRRYLGTV